MTISTKEIKKTVEIDTKDIKREIKNMPGS